MRSLALMDNTQHYMVVIIKRSITWYCLTGEQAKFKCVK